MCAIAMSAHRYCTDCPECKKTESQGRFRVFSRTASRAGSLRRAFQFSPSESYRHIQNHPEVKEFYESLPDGFEEQLYPYPCCPNCTVCAEAARAFRVARAFRKNSIFIQMLRELEEEIALLTLTAPMIAPRPEHREEFESPELRAAHREEVIDDRTETRYNSVLENFRRNEEFLPHPSEIPKSEGVARDFEDQRLEDGWYSRLQQRNLTPIRIGTEDNEPDFELFPNAVLKDGIYYYNFYRDGEGYELSPEEEEITDGPALRLSYLRAISREEMLEHERAALEQEVTASAGNKLSSELQYRLWRNNERRAFVPKARLKLKALLRQDIIEESGLDKAVQESWIVKCWRAGLLQSVCGPGRNERQDIPFFYIPRYKVAGGFTYAATVSETEHSEFFGDEPCREPGDGHFDDCGVGTFGECTIDTDDKLCFYVVQKVHPSLNLRWHRNPRNVGKPGHQGLVPRDIKPFRPPRALIVRHFQNYRKRVKHAGVYGDARCVYLGVDECGRNNKDDGEFFHLHLLVNLPDGNLSEVRRQFQLFWHAQCGNIYWGKHKNGEPIEFCKKLQDDAKTARYVSKYLNKSVSPGRVWTSQGMNLNRAVLEESVVAINPQFAHRGVSFGRHKDGRYAGVPTYISALTDTEIETCLHEHWVGINFEERRVGHKPVLVASASSTPARSIHCAGGVAIDFGGASEEVLPLSYWVPKKVWQAAQSGMLDCVASENLNEALSSWADHYDDVIFPPD